MKLQKALNIVNKIYNLNLAIYDMYRIIFKQKKEFHKICQSTNIEAFEEEISNIKLTEDGLAEIGLKINSFNNFVNKDDLYNELSQEN